MDLRLCDDAGMVAGKYLDVLNRLRGLSGKQPYEGKPFPCTGSAHLAGEHIRCVSTAHLRPLDALPERPDPVDEPLPEDLERLLRHPEIVTDRDGDVARLIADHLRRDLTVSTVPRDAYLMLFALYEKAVRDAA
jgi:hypothetical protein